MVSDVSMGNVNLMTAVNTSVLKNLWTQTRH